ncbi:hypothetical protein GCM10009827_101180 [Dactylosporangium maewongense]|uniref:Dephospho-CoA kinase n=1 Tax=Dactylosporangium maewongense TaxID=634393 RepID=A0ABN2CRY3_9ACTN
MNRPPLLLLAGTSESGKSTAGAYLAGRGAHRVKIRTILTTLTSGIPAVHEGVPMREGFEHAEFVDRMLHLPIPDGRRAVLVESFIDTDLAEATRRAWPDRCWIVFITATRTTRLQRLTADRQLSTEQAAAVLDAKDARKRVTEQLDLWRAIADRWIDNDTGRAEFLDQLDRTLDQLTRHEGVA